ncbi:MAG: hypothetical protein H6730_32220 [Deltaproteobacteria bacterium]|nr:hypothetical protein [Deltaproteobacteria bacterium]
MSKLFLGVDGGGTKTVAAVADESGRVVAHARTGGSNYQAIGASAAGRELRAAVDSALKAAGATMDDVAAAAFGMAGADRASEMAIVEAMVDAHVAVKPRFVENDALLVLRAGTKDAVGVGLVAGTGTNCIGRDRYGRRHQIGGMGNISGDVGYAEDLAMRALGGAWMAFDGRTGPSMLTGALCEALGVESVEHLPALMVRGELPEAVVKASVQVLFRCARAGDGLARRIVEDTGSRLGAAAVAAMRALVLRGPNAILVLGGAMFQAEGHDLLVESCTKRVRTAVSEAHVIVLDTHPVVGAVLFARDLVDHAPRDFAVAARESGRGI